jgi:DNA-binding transcriptional MerR regulator
MDVAGYISDVFTNIKNDGATGLKRSFYPPYYKGLEQLEYIKPAGKNIFDSDWDLLVIADACRYDLASEVLSEYEFIPGLSSDRSVGSNTPMWMNRTFPERNETEETVYVCGNPFSADILDQTEFAELIEVWKYAWEEPGTVPPSAITDESIRVFREQNTENKRVIAHYMQPHCPFISNPRQNKKLDNFGNQESRDIWAQLRDGEVSRDNVWRDYKENLRIVLDEIKALLENVNANDVIITSDHGNALGEYGVYGHPNPPIAVLRNVPWIETTASNTGDRTIEHWRNENTVSREKKLQALGYL